MDQKLERKWRLLFSERVLWQGKPLPNIPKDLRWTLIPALFCAFSAVVALFAGLMWVSGIAAVRPASFLSFFLLATGLAIRNAPRHLLDSCEYMVTDRRVIWKRGTIKHSMDKNVITYARIHWHRSVPGVGHLELVRAVPFGPFARKQRIWLHNIQTPDILYSLIRGVEPSEYAGYDDVRLTDRLDIGERVLWGASPEGWRLGYSELLTTALGVMALITSVLYGYKSAGVILSLEGIGLAVQSWTWIMLFLAVMISWSIITTVGIALVWNGLWGARKAGCATEYILTDGRVLIRRGRTELSVDRRRIVDIIDVPSTGGSRTVHLILDAPQSRAIDDSGLFSNGVPPRATVPPVLYEIKELELFRNILFRRNQESMSALSDAA